MGDPITILAELSTELQRRINDLQVANYRSEQIIRYLAFCQIENDICLDSEIYENTSRNESDFYPVDSGTDIKTLPVSVIDEISSTSTCNSLENVLTLAREIREKRAGNKSGSQNIIKKTSIISETSHSKRVSDYKTSR